MKHCLDKGYVKLIDRMGSDESIVNAARVSYDGKGSSTTRRLIRYLTRHRHTSPFEMAEMIFEVKVPIYVWRQWIRHRTANVNEISGRYSVLPSDFHVIDDWRKQSTTNKQGSDPEWISYEPLYDVELYATQEYEERLEQGITREQARTCLPLSIYTKAVWKCDLHNIFHFLKLRMDSHAQEEIRVYANAIAEYVKEYYPLSWEAFEDYVLGAVTFSRQEMQYISRLPGPYELSESELKEFIQKCS